MRKSFRNLIHILFVILFVLSACAPITTTEPTPEPTEEPTATPEPIVITDGLGNEITLQGPAHKIVSLSPSMTESLFALGAGDRIIARESNSTYPEEAQEIEDIGMIWEGLPIEKIVSLEPDLVVAAQIISPDQVQNLRDVGLTVFWQSNPADFPGLYENLRQLAQLVGQEEEAETLISSMKDRVAAVEERVADVKEKPLVFYELDATDPSNPYTVGEGTFISYVIDKAGGENLGDALEGNYVQISSEEIIARNPDYIILGDAAYGMTPEAVAERPGWDQLTAVQEGRVLPINDDLISLPGPRLVEGLEEMAKMIHPELFGN
jgi:iron complex transport system substrate-binding protein